MAFRTEWDTEPNETYDVWTSVNGSEVIPGIVSPLVATTMQRFEAETWRTLMAPYPRPDAVPVFDEPVANFMGVFAGRLALNNAFSAAILSTMDPAIAQAILQQFFTGASGGERFIVDLPEDVIAETHAQVTEERVAAADKVPADHERLMAERHSGRAGTDRALGLADAWARYLALAEENYVDLLGTHLLVSGAAGEYQVRLGGVLDAGGLDPNAVVPLCSGLGDVESSKPALALHDLAAFARQHPDVQMALETDDLEAVAARIETQPDDGWRAFGAAFDEFLELWGYRVQGEADPTNADWSEQPTFALSQVRSMLALTPEQSPRAAIERAKADRATLEARLRAALPDELAGPFDEMLAKAQHFTRLRELSKAVWVLGTRRARASFLAAADGLAAGGALDAPDDARFLTVDEIDAIVGGTPIADARDRVARRRGQAGEAEQYRLPDNWVGEPVAERADVGAARDAFTGLGVSVGRGPVTGTARIIPSAEAGLARDLAPGDILIAPFTDAPWTPLFVVAGAVVVETGGVLSHAATVAREFDIPAVVMVKGATALIADGDTVTVDGAAGTVTVTERAVTPA